MGRDQDKTRLTLGGDLSGSLPAYTACTVAVAHQTLAWPELAVEMPQVHVWPLVELARGEEEEMDIGDGDGHAAVHGHGHGHVHGPRALQVGDPLPGWTCC